MNRDAGTPTFDACVFHEWPELLALAPYMPSEWGRLISERTKTLASPRVYIDPRGAKDPPSVPENGPAGSDLSLLTAQVLDGGKRDRVVLGYDDGLFSTMVANRYAADVIVSAANDWTAAEWLSVDDRLHGLVMVSMATPDVAAEEIRRVGANERMVGVALGGNGLNVPFGHPAYHPVYRAASDLGLPVVIQAGPSDAFGDSPLAPVSAGYASTVAEYRALMWETHCTHLASMIVEGVFSLFPSLKLVFVGGGLTWITGQLLRLDFWYRIQRSEARWLDRLPSEYFAEHVRVVTHGIETPPRPELLLQALETIPAVERVLMYGSGYPDADWQEPEAVAAQLPREWHEGVFHGNALETFRWPDAHADGRLAATSVETKGG
jgi:predicted TIM-barrel fold metal-dependent hydrolase